MLKPLLGAILLTGCAAVPCPSQIEIGAWRTKGAMKGVDSGGYTETMAGTSLTFDIIAPSECPAYGGADEESD